MAPSKKSATKKAAKKAAKKTAKKAAKKPSGGSANARLEAQTIRVRMYRVGFGDCFLLSLPAAKGSGSADTHHHVLVDCGVHFGGDINTMDRAVANIAAVTGGRLAAVIATHSHQDHISGFGKFGEEFGRLDIAEVWLPWCENPRSPAALKLQRKHAALAEMLGQHFDAQRAAGVAAAQTPQRAAAAAAVANISGNQKALQLLRSGFGVGAEVRYLEAGQVLRDPAGVEGLTVRVLGPPRDQKFLSKMDPPKDQRYLRAGAAGGVEVENALQPFPAKWVVNPQAPNYPGPVLSREERDELKDSLSDTELDGLAFALDQVKNNTSLVTLFVFRGKYLLFPGDAQYGNWKFWLDQEEAEEILPRISFLKVAHHGSHNATPRSALERMAEGGFAAMVSTQSVPWDSIPRVPLMKRLREKATKGVVRSDWLKLADAPGPLANTEPPVPKRLPADFKKGAFWYDYLLRLK
ncbi:MAG TPA: MBL fold metallo-hydrolase [Pyrinomonadaceae bacterium]|nr:MBL fold metallo-hydrolase [Pyrinomonadaceae bacterium]